MKKLLTLTLILVSLIACAQRKVVSDYNYRKAVEAYFEDDDDEKALELLNKQIDETPFAKAFMWYLVILVHHIIRIGQIITNKEQSIFRQQSFGLF